MQTLRWSKASGSKELAPHELRITTQFGGVKLVLLLRKSLPQTLVVNLQVAQEVFLQYWRSQGQNWQQTQTENVDGRFFCIRYVQLGANFFLVWRVQHISDVAYDTLDTFEGSLKEMIEFYAL